MAYNLKLHIRNDTKDSLQLVEQTCWIGAGTLWHTVLGGYSLDMKNSGSSGMLRFLASNGEFFTIAVGVHNYKRWCDVMVNTGDSTPLIKLHPNYYDEKHAKYKCLWEQSAEDEMTTKAGEKVRVSFYVKEGNELRGEITWSG
ncbi:hypothetical protein OQA88_2540 [Cercophora sp. LCS_1]